MRTALMAAMAAAALAAGAGQVLAADKPADPTPVTERPDTVESAVTTPAQDLNIKKTDIPEALIRANAAPAPPVDLPPA